MERWQSDFDRSDGGRTGGSGGVRVDQMIAGLHTGHDAGTGGHGVNRCKAVRHPVLQLCCEFFEHAISQGLCLRWSGLVALGQGGISPLLFHSFFC